MKYRLKLSSFLIFGATLSSLLGFMVVQQHTATALSAHDYNYGNIIDDTVFYNKSTMTVQQIQTFLDQLIPNCDIWGTGPSEYGGGTRAQYAASRGWHAPPYSCLNKYHENPTTGETSFEKGGSWFTGGQSAAQIIYDAAQKYDINPQVLLVLLKKESGGPLTADSWPLKSQYKYAMGYACPDSGPNNSANCDASKAGFYKQMELAAWQLKYYKEHPNDYRYHIGWNDIQYSPDINCGTRRTYIENIATLSLYIYTPYVPNSGALANYPGTAHCGAYGNRNFFMYFSEWFGSTRGLPVIPQLQQRYNELGNSSGYLGKPYSAGGCGIPGGGCYQNFIGGNIYWSPSAGAWDTSGAIGSKWASMGAERSYLQYPTASEVRGLKNNGSYQQFQVGRIYWSPVTGAWDVSGAIGDKWIEMNAQDSIFNYPVSSETRGLKNNGSYQQFQVGRIYWSPVTGAHPVAGGIGDYWLGKGAQDSTLGYPTSGEKLDSLGRVYQEFEGGKVYWTALQGAWGVLVNISNRYNTLGDIKSYLGAPYTLGGCGIPGGGCYQNFIGGNIYWSPSAGAWDTSGAIGSKWASMGAERSYLQYPTASEVRGLKNNGSYQQFQVGRIYWSPVTGAAPISGNIFERWSLLGGVNSLYGYPASTETRGLKNNGSYQQFQVGRIYWSPVTGAHPVAGGIGDYWLGKGAQDSTLGYPTSGEKLDSLGRVYQEFEGGKVYWTALQGAWN